MQNRNDRRRLTSLRSLVLISAFIIAVAVVAVPFYSVRSSSLPTGGSSQASVPSRANENQVGALTASALAPRAPASGLLLPVPQSLPEGIATYLASNCTTPKTDFNLGETVCAKASGVPVTLFPWRVLWIDPAGFVRQSNDAVANDQTEYRYTLPSTRTTDVNGQTVDNRGTWKANLVRSNGAVRQTALFTVHDPAQSAADVFVQKFVRGGVSSVSSGDNIAFLLVVGNQGPDTAVTVHLVDSVPTGSTLVSFSQQSGPACVPIGTGDCTMASLANGERAEFTAIYNTGSSAPGTYFTSASVSSLTTDSDTSNNTSTAQFEITSSGGGSQCTLTCPTSPAPVNNEPGQNGATVDWDGPNNDNVPVTTGSNCGAVSTSVSSPHFFPIGITTITASTESGETCTFTVTVIDNENPDIGNCPADMTVTEDSNTPGEAVVNYQTPTATDNSGSVTVTCEPPSGSSFTASGSPHTVTCTATDQSGNTDSCTFNVTVTSGSTDCTLTPPADITANSDTNQCGTNVTYQNPTQSGTSCGTVSCDHPSGSFFPVGTTVVTCRDTSGASTRFNVTVNDTTAPAPNVDPLPTAQGQCTVTVTEPTATDNCNGTISGTTQDPTTYDTPGTYTVHWTYTDASGNTRNQNQTVIVNPDTSPPVITTCAANRTITADSSCAVMPDMTEEVGATDNCTTVTVTQSPAAGTTLGSGNTTVTFTVTDNAGNSATCSATVTVVDNTPPTVTAPADSSASADANCQAPVPDYVAGSTASDNCGNPTVTQSPVAGTLVGLGPHTVTVTATDSAGNSSSDEVVFTVNDTTAPTVQAPADSSASADASCQAPVPNYVAGSTASDNCDNSVTLTQSPAAGTMVGKGPHTVTVTGTDDAGNQGSDTVIFTVNDTTAPVITCPANITRSNDPGMCSANINPGTATATDNCDTPTVTGTRSDGGPLNGSYPVGTTTITWRATDESNNQSSCIQSITVNDTENPTITCPSSFTLEPTCPSGAVGNYTTPVGTDNCPGAITTRTGLASGSVFPIGTTTVTYSVTDAHGNGPVSCSFTVTVKTPQAVTQDLINSVNASSLTGTQKNGLIAKLQAALDAINKGQTNVACNKLDAFINSVQTLVSHGDITSAQGTSWINSANNVRNTIGCTNNPCT